MTHYNLPILPFLVEGYFSDYKILGSISFSNRVKNDILRNKKINGGLLVPEFINNIMSESNKVLLVLCMAANYYVLK